MTFSADDNSQFWLCSEQHFLQSNITLRTIVETTLTRAEEMDKEATTMTTLSAPRKRPKFRADLETFGDLHLTHTSLSHSKNCTVITLCKHNLKPSQENTETTGVVVHSNSQKSHELTLHDNISPPENERKPNNNSLVNYTNLCTPRAMLCGCVLMQTRPGSHVCQDEQTINKLLSVSN